jgi:hypothetical protein
VKTAPLDFNEPLRSEPPHLSSLAHDAFWQAVNLVECIKHKMNRVVKSKLIFLN